jgi:uncharacterized protein (TIGR02246 family)
MTEVVVTGDTENQAMRPFKAILGQMAGAWNKGNAEAFAAVFGDQADFIDLMGGHSVGRAAIGKVHAALFAGPYSKSTVEYRIEKTKPLGPQVMVLFLRLKLTLQRDGQPTEVFARPTLTLLRTNQGWRIAVYQGTRVVDRGAAGKAGAEAPAADDGAAAEPEAEKKAAKKKG